MKRRRCGQSYPSRLELYARSLSPYLVSIGFPTISHRRGWPAEQSMQKNEAGGAGARTVGAAANPQEAAGWERGAPVYHKNTQHDWKM